MLNRVSFVLVCFLSTIAVRHNLVIAGITVDNVARGDAASFNLDTPEDNLVIATQSNAGPTSGSWYSSGSWVQHRHPSLDALGSQESHVGLSPSPQYILGNVFAEINVAHKYAVGNVNAFSYFDLDFTVSGSQPIYYQLSADLFSCIRFGSGSFVPGYRTNFNDSSAAVASFQFFPTGESGSEDILRNASGLQDGAVFYGGADDGETNIRSSGQLPTGEHTLRVLAEVNYNLGSYLGTDPETSSDGRATAYVDFGIAFSASPFRPATSSGSLPEPSFGGLFMAALGLPKRSAR